MPNVYWDVIDWYERSRYRNIGIAREYVCRKHQPSWLWIFITNVLQWNVFHLWIAIIIESKYWLFTHKMRDTHTKYHINSYWYTGVQVIEINQCLQLALCEQKKCVNGNLFMDYGIDSTYVIRSKFPDSFSVSLSLSKRLFKNEI